MKNRLLFPAPFRMIGLLLAPVFVYLLSSDFELHVFRRSAASIAKMQANSFVYSENASADVWLMGLLLSLLAVAFSRLRYEDEYTNHQRLRALMQSVYVNYCLTAVIIFTTYGLSFIGWLCMNVFSLLLVFSVLFYGRILIQQLRKPRVA